MASAAASIRVEWGGPNGNVGKVRGPGGRVIWVRYSPREPRTPRVPRPLQHDEWPTSAAFAELVSALSPDTRRPWRIKIVGARIPTRSLARRCAADGPTMAAVTRSVSAAVRTHYIWSPGRCAPGPPNGPLGLGPRGRWFSVAQLSRNWRGRFHLSSEHRREGRRMYRHAFYGHAYECTNYADRLPEYGPPQRRQEVSGSRFATAPLAAWLRAAAAAALGRRAPAAAFFAAVD